MLSLVKLKRSLSCAFRGLLISLREEQSLILELLIFSVGILLAYFVQVSHLELLILFLCASVVIAAELLNTAIERVVDLSCDEQKHPLARDSKDVAAAAVLFVGLATILIYAVIILPRLMSHILH